MLVYFNKLDDRIIYIMVWGFKLLDLDTFYVCLSSIV